MDTQPSTSNAPLFSKQRSLPIPKVVNNYILTNYGAAYYSSVNLSEKQEILKKIEEQCLQSGYVNIRAEEVERRLKNMKSHYRRKKQDIERGSSQTIVWEYYDILDRIFSEIDKNKPVEKQTVVKIETQVGVKRSAEDIKAEIAEKAQDLSVKRPRVIEFCNFNEITKQIPVKYEPKPINQDIPTGSQSFSAESLNILPGTSNSVAGSSNSEKISSQSQAGSSNPSPVTAMIQLETNSKSPADIETTIASIKFIDQQRLEVNRQLVALETYRCQLDTFGCHLNQRLIKIIQENRSIEN